QRQEVDPSEQHAARSERSGPRVFQQSRHRLSLGGKNVQVIGGPFLHIGVEQVVDQSQDLLLIQPVAVRHAAVCHLPVAGEGGGGDVLLQVHADSRLGQ